MEGLLCEIEGEGRRGWPKQHTKAGWTWAAANATTFCAPPHENVIAKTACPNRLLVYIHPYSIDRFTFNNFSVSLFTKTRNNWKLISLVVVLDSIYYCLGDCTLIPMFFLFAKRCCMHIVSLLCCGCLGTHLCTMYALLVYLEALDLSFIHETAGEKWEKFASLVSGAAKYRRATLFHSRWGWRCWLSSKLQEPLVLQ